MTEPMPKGAPRSHIDPKTGRPVRLLRMRFGPLPDDPAEAAIESGRRAALRAEMNANWEEIRKNVPPVEDGFWPNLADELKYGWPFGYRIYKALGGRH